MYMYVMCRNEISLEQHLQNYQSKVVAADEIHRITVRRKHILVDAFTAMRMNFNRACSLQITFIGEAGIDAGGPCREFFRLVISDIMANNSFFQGLETSRIPLHNLKELKKSSFKIIGEIVALSIVHGGPQCLSHAVVDYLSYGIHKVYGDLDDVPQPCVREKIKKVHRYLAKCTDI